MSASNTQFTSKIGLIAATVGSAVGLGNIWRFPAEAQAGGGAAFLLVYVLCVIVLGIPCMLAEFSLGRQGGTDAIGAFARVQPRQKGWRWAGALSVVTAFLISVFYMVVAGWTLEYLWQSLSGGLFEPQDGLAPGYDLFVAKERQYVASGFRPLCFTLLMAVVNMGILLGGVRKGIERLSNLLMPLLFVLLIIFSIVSLTLPDAGEGLRFFFSPDFGKITPRVILSALGQAFFSLSLGMGILVTYAAYYPPQTRLARTATTVSVLDMLVAVLMGVIIFPAITSFGLSDHGIEGTTLVFVTLPEVFLRLPATWLWSSLFFLLLSIAALTSTVSILEVSVRTLQDRLHLSRRRAVMSVMVPIFVLSGICALSFGPLAHVEIAGRNIFNFLDFLTAEIMLPVSAICICLFVGWFVPDGMLKRQLTNDGTLRSYVAGAALFIIRWVAPLLIFLVLISPLL